MSRILHQLKKDLVHQRWALAGWATLLLVHLLVSGFQILRHVPNPQSTDQFAGLVASWVVFMPLLLVILVVQTDTPVGTSAFWMTRPLRGAQMLAAKALFVVLLFVILPLAVEMIILLLRGAGTLTLLAIPEFSVVRLPVVLGAFALGAATQRFLHALTLAAIGAGVSFATVLLSYYIFWGDVGGSTPQPLSGSRGIVALWTLAAAFAVVVVMQFLTRREGPSRSLFIAGIVGAMILQTIWPWNVFGGPPKRGDVAGDQIDLRLDPGAVRFGSMQNSRGSVPGRYVSSPIEIRCDELAENMFLAPVTSRVNLTGASSIAFENSSSHSVAPHDSRFSFALESQLSSEHIQLISDRGHGPPKQGRDRFHNVTNSFRMADNNFDELSSKLEQVRFAMDIGLFEFERAGELPLREGATWTDKGDRIEIVRVRATDSSLQVSIREQVLTQIFARRNAFGRNNRYPWVLLLANRNTNTAIALKQVSQLPTNYRGASWLSPFLRAEKTLSVDLITALRENFTPEDIEDWRLHATLIVVRKHNRGSFHLTQEVDASAIRRDP